MAQATDKSSTKIASARRKLPGTDLLCQYRPVMNMPGVTRLWVGRIKHPAVAGTRPSYETMEEAWIFEGEDFYSFDDLMNAWKGAAARRVH